MSGHSKWSQIKRQKGVADTRRGQLFTKLAREITLAARQGGTDPEMNARLRLAVQRAKNQNMPLDGIERAIKRASGPSEGAALAEITFEGYGPGGAAILVQAVTDNRNRTLSEVRNAFTRGGGNMGESGCVSWLFESKGVLVADAGQVSAEELALSAIDAGADDVKVEDDSVEIYTKPEDLEAVRETLEPGFAISSVDISLVPTTVIKLDDKAALQTLKLLDKLEELDEVQHVFSNADFPDEVVEQYRSSA